MPDVIKILPETLINKIAAGEVVQRPASVVKELVENSIDAQALTIVINLQEAGKTLIQVIDDGTGMSQTDARLAFERHATSKIAKTEDLFHITTKGFRGEALASIAAVAQVELRTRREQDQLGTRVVIEGGKFILQEPISCPKGANFLVKNLFFNVPARRKFLKSDQTELKHVLTEFFRVAIPHPDIRFELHHNKAPIYKLQPSSLKERIVNLFDKTYNKYLIPLDADAGFIKVYGFIGIPESARKKYAEQYFFVNNRFFKSSHLHRAVMKAYEKVLSPELKPLYFIFFEIDPARIDVNIHPTKIEVNFQDADSIYQILISAIKRSLAQYGVVPMIDFETEAFIPKNAINADLDNSTPFEMEEDLDGYNPFEEPIETTEEAARTKTNNYTPKNFKKNNIPDNWSELFEITQNKIPNHPDKEQRRLDMQTQSTNQSKFLNFKAKYIITPLKSGLAIINIRRAYETIFYQEIINNISDNNIFSQQTLYPLQVSFDHRQLQSFLTLRPQFEAIGFKFEQISDTSFNIVAIPSFGDMTQAHKIIIDMINDPDSEALNLEQMTAETLALSFARSKARIADTRLEEKEMESLVTKLFASFSPKLSPSGKKNFYILKLEEIDKFFK